jgi:leucyl aminopeptidase
MHGLMESARGGKAVAIAAVDAKSLRRVAERFGKPAARWVAASGFAAEAGRFCLLPDAHGHLHAVLAGVGDVQDPFALSALPQALPAGTYRLDDAGLALDAQRAALSWGLGAYRYTRYRRSGREAARLLVDRATARAVTPLLDAISSVRDLINTPTQDMGPAELAGQVRELAQAHGGKFREWVGEGLLKANFPTIHAVGRAASRAPRLAELTWGKPGAPHVVLVGKGVCFDTGGLDIKSSDGMRWMKKDMGGAAHAIALAGLIMQAQLPVRLSVLIPAVENAVSGDAYRPGEVIRTRAGLTVEVDNTDAEGRLVLCDALAYAAESEPDLIIDMATLTGAARVALGPELPALFANRDDIAQALLNAGVRERDQLWRLPLWQPYRSMLDSRIADTGNSGSSRLGGAIVAALYLQRFVPSGVPWLHLDVYAWNDSDRPGRPHGGDAQGLRAFFRMLQERYTK